MPLPLVLASRGRALGLRRRGLGDSYIGWPSCATNTNPANSLRATFGYSGSPNYPTSAAPNGSTWFIFPQGNILLADSPACPGNSGPGCLNQQGCYIAQINGYLMPQSQYAVYAGQVSGSNIVNVSNQTLNTVPATPAPASGTPGGAAVTHSAAPPLNNNVRQAAGSTPAAASCFSFFGVSDTCAGPIGILTALAIAAAGLAGYAVVKEVGRG